ncbi:MAG: hypothetical protein C0605_13520 [Hyphomicrobiales bacterium]|nr:MAG: hypothetical protein C0605_13520 [Hyphomicrobiales bacterium]
MYNCDDDVRAYYGDKVQLPDAERTEMRKRRNANRDRLKSGLEKNEDPATLFEASQGSYAMWTMVQHSEKDYDIDDGVYFSKEDLKGPKGGDKTPADAKEMVRGAVSTGTLKAEPKVLKNCVRVEYVNDGYHVDLPVYREVKHDENGNELAEPYYELASSEWKRSDARAVTKWFKDEIKDKSLDDKKAQLRRIVKYVKTFARSRNSWRSSIASGFMISKLVADHYRGDANRDDSALRETMKAIRDQLDVSLEIWHPVLAGEKLTKGPDDGRAKFIRERLRESLEHLAVLDESDCTRKKALKTWDKVFATTYFSDRDDGSDGDGSGNGSGGNGSSAKILGSASAPASAVNRRGGGRYGLV